MQIQILTFILTTETSLKIASHAFQVEVLGPHVVIMLILTKHKVKKYQKYNKQFTNISNKKRFFSNINRVLSLTILNLKSFYF